MWMNVIEVLTGARDLTFNASIDREATSANVQTDMSSITHDSLAKVHLLSLTSFQLLLAPVLLVPE